MFFGFLKVKFKINRSATKAIKVIYKVENTGWVKMFFNKITEKNYLQRTTKQYYLDKLRIRFNKNNQRRKSFIRERQKS